MKFFIKFIMNLIIEKDIRYGGRTKKCINKIEQKEQKNHKKIAMVWLEGLCLAYASYSLLIKYMINFLNIRLGRY